MSKHVVILGGGLAGLSCGYELVQRGHRVTVLEREPHVGGMASSFVEDGDEYWTQDFGPHRFHSQDKHLIQHVRDILGDNVVTAERLSRIVLFNKFFDYPLVTKNVLTSMPRHLLVKALLDYAWVRFCDKTRLRKFDERTFEGWVTKRFGTTLYKIFFGQYTEKAWGMSPALISSDWASQRITVLSLWDTIVKTLRRPKSGETPRTLVKSFIYPKYGGIGELPRGYARRIEASNTGSRVLTNAPAVKVHRDGMRVTGVEYGKHERQVIAADHYVNTIPVTALANALAPKAPPEIATAAKSLEYVSIVFVYLKLNKPSVSPDSWVYLPEKHLTVHRISEFKNFSPYCAPEGKTQICAEITCRRGDRIWRSTPDELRDIATRDLASVGLIRPEDVIGTTIRKIPFAYPIYDLDYREHLVPVMDYVGRLENMQTTGRQGNYRYNNMDQSVEMGRKLGQELATGQQTGHQTVATGQEYFG